MSNPSSSPQTGARVQARFLFWIECVTLLLVGYFHFHFMQVQYYVDGAYYNDTSLLGALSWRNDWLLQHPACFGFGSFFNTHASPIFLLFSGLSYLTPLALPDWYSVVMALLNLPLAFALILILRTYRTGKLWVDIALILGLSMLLQLNGIVLMMTYFPHFEVAICGLIVIAWKYFIDALNRVPLARWKCGLALLALFSMREDAGFHLAAPALIIAVLLAISRKPWSEYRPYLGLGLLGVAVSMTTIVLQKHYFLHDDAFARMYLGDPPFAHITAALIKERLGFWITHRVYVWAPIVILSSIAVWKRNPFYAAGALAYVPWLVVNLLASQSTPGLLNCYYAFPLVITTLWLLIADQLSKRHSISSPLSPLRWLVLILLIGTSTAACSDYKLIKYTIGVAFRHPEISHTAYREAEARINPALIAGPLYYGPSVVCLIPKTVDVGQLLPDTVPNERVESLVYFQHGTKQALVEKLIASQGLTYSYAFPSTQIRVASRHPITFPVLSAIPRSLKTAVLDSFVVYFNAQKLPTESKANNHFRVEIARDAVGGYQCESPFLQLAPGRYKVRFQLQATPSDTSQIGLEAFSVDSGIIAQRTWIPNRKDQPNSLSATLVFEVTPADSAIRFRLWRWGQCATIVTDVSYEAWQPEQSR